MPNARRSRQILQALCSALNSKGASEVQPAGIITNSFDRVTAYDLSAECNATDSSYAAQQPVQQACRLRSSTASAPLHTTKALLPCLDSTSSALSRQRLSSTATPGSLCSPTQAHRPMSIYSVAAVGKHRQYATAAASAVDPKLPHQASSSPGTEQLSKAKGQGPDISLLSALLQSQWDHEQNAHLGNILIYPGTGRKVHWTCNQCPDGHQHSWAATVNNRKKGSGCPYCSGQAVCPHNSLAHKAPHLAKEWDTAGNAKSPHDYTVSSHHLAHWLCASGHKWVTRIAHRTHQQSGCPVCARLRGRPRAPSLVASSGNIMQVWNWEQNAAEGLDPHKLTCGSQKKAHFRCSKFPLHQWSAEIMYVAKAKESGCPYCSGRRSSKSA